MRNNSKKQKIVLVSIITILSAISLYLSFSYTKIIEKPGTVTHVEESLQQKRSSNWSISCSDIIEGKVITLKKMTIASAFDYFKMFSSNVRRGLEFPEKVTFGYVSRMVTANVKKIKKGLMIAYNIFDNKDDKMVGSINIKSQNDPYYGQLSMWINENYRGGGRIQEALLLISQAYFNARPTINSYIGHARFWNKASFRAMKNFGFKEIDEYIENGKPTIHIMELTREALEKKIRNKGAYMSKKILFILIPNYRDEEFTIPYEILCKEKYTVDVAGLKKGIVIGANGHQHKPNLLLSNLKQKDFNKYDALVIPGGPGSTKFLWGNKKVQNIIKYFHESHKLVAAICYAVIAVVQSGVLLNKHATVYPTNESKKIFAEYGVQFNKDGCVVLVPEKIITAQGPTFAKDFGKAILNFLKK